MEIKNRVAALLMLMGMFSNPLLANDSFAKSSLWQDVKPLVQSDKSSLAKTHPSFSKYQQARFLTLNHQQMAGRLALTATKSATPTVIDLPLPDGRIIKVSILSDSILPTSLSARYPQIKTYRIVPDDFLISGKLDMTENGFHAMLQTRAGETIFLDTASKNKKQYISYQKSKQRKSSESSLSCSASLKNESFAKRLQLPSLRKQARTPDSLVTYRIAIAATGEYTAKHGGTVAGALSAIVTTLNRVNQVFEQDLGIHLVLVENNDELIYTDASSDPYFAEEEELLDQNQSNIDLVIGSKNYDIGHLFTTSGGGLANISSTCDDAKKARGYSGMNHSSSDSFDLDFVAHEIGHQFGATHTFNGEQGLCSGGTRTDRTAFEPGSGSTIMSYAGYCGQDNLQTNTDAMFHIGSIQQIRSFVTSGQGSQCGVSTQIDNHPPKVNAGKDYVIPAQTPFELEGNASDSDGDSLVYSWEQVDAGERSAENHDKGDNALFRVHMPSSSNKRTFPVLLNILNHTTTRGESLPIQQREMAFKLVVQDSYNVAQSDSVKVQVQRTGSRFALNMPRSQYTLGATHEIYWNVANTNQAPINCDSVDVLLSVNSGYTFTRLLSENVPNTGKASITIPVDLGATSRARFKIRCSDNIFFAISYRNFSLNGADHSKRIMLADEDLPELNLLDKNLNKNITAFAGSSAIATKETAGGGAFNSFFLLLLLVTFVMKKELFLLQRFDMRVYLNK